MTRSLVCSGLVAATTLIAVLISGCAPEGRATGAGDRSFNVSGPVRLELKNATGESRITAGSPGVVRIHAEFRVYAWSWGEAQGRLRELQNDPPISQDGNVVRLGGGNWGWVWPNTSIDYSVTVPPDSELEGSSASGNVSVLGISGPVNINVISGNASAQGITGDTRIHAVSGSIRVFDIRGSADVSTVSGSIDVNKVQGQLRARSTSGTTWIERPAGDVQADAVSGGMNIMEATGDLRAKTVSGGISIDGNPSSGRFWDINTMSGSVVLGVRSNASFRLYAHSGSGTVDLGIPAATQQNDRHSVTARIGDGAGRVEIGTFSGGISIH
jgi:DUF4097 and DUF4098 domain-containing protein YvlB